jgi:hypothetical protein
MYVCMFVLHCMYACSVEYAKMYVCVSMYACAAFKFVLMYSCMMKVCMYVGMNEVPSFEREEAPSTLLSRSHISK